jgi:hypothetical protein
MIHENMPKLGITEEYSISNNANLEEIDNIPDNEVETKLEFTIPTFQLKLTKSYYQKIQGSDDHSISQLLNHIFIDFLRNQENITSESGELLFGQKSPRKDVLEKLEKISEQFMKCESFPILSRSQIKDGIRSTLGVMDSRTEKKYFKCIIYFVETRTGQPSSYYSQYNLDFFRDRIKSALTD